MQQNLPSGENTYIDDEISLYDLYSVLLKRKKLIGAVFISVLLVCAIYLLVAQKIYKATAVLLPPTSGDVFLTNIDIKGVTDFKPEDVFKLYTQELTSNERWNAFAKSEKKIVGTLSAEAQFRNPFKLEKDKNLPNDHSLLTYETANKASAAEIVQRYLKFAEQGLIDVLTQQITQYIDHNTRALELEIQFERDAAKQVRMDKIVALENDLTIAKKLGITTDNIYFSLAGKAAGNKTGVLNVFPGDTTTPTYLRGTRVISAELEALKNRKSDDPYIPSLREKQNQLLKLAQVKFKPASFHPYRLDGEIVAPDHPIKPKKSLVLLLGGILGLFLGIFAAFIVEFLVKANEQRREELDRLAARD
ncbi:MAG: hypothetical protein GC149_06820 [Gammaproteobacteria bacterium]|nr:hypothetical protein [Gammaproteobacteria bacterium]